MEKLSADRLRGSLRGCLDIMGLPDPQVAEYLSILAQPSGAMITAGRDKWRPRGREDYKETTLVDEADFLPPSVSQELTGWWLEVVRGARLPNWDMASTCQIEGKRGLILVEAKAHDKELSEAGKAAPTSPNGKLNHERIGKAIAEANAGLKNVIDKDWRLTRDSHYQLCNRFAWTWKLASLGVPIVLIYLGFLNAREMLDQGEPFTNHAAWEACLRYHAKSIVPEEAWGKRFQINGVPAWFIIKSMELPADVKKPICQ